MMPIKRKQVNDSAISFFEVISNNENRFWRVGQILVQLYLGFSRTNKTINALNQLSDTDYPLKRSDWENVFREEGTFLYVEAYVQTMTALRYRQDFARGIQFSVNEN
jgi:hypothetical protein